MKNIKILFCLLSLFAFKINAIAGNFKNEDLIKRMSYDETVNKLMTNVSNVNLTYMFVSDLSQINPELQLDIDRIKLQNIEYKKIIENKFPEYNQLTNQEKQEVILTIFNNTFLESWLACASKNVANFFICAGISVSGGAAAWRILKFTGCFATAIAVDMAEEVASGGATTPVLPGELALEAEWCMKMAKGSAASTVGSIGVCVAKTANKIFDCGS